MRKLPLSLSSVALLLVLWTGTTAAADLLGATLSTTEEWVEIESHATVSTTVVLEITVGSFVLDETTFSLEPGQRHRVAYSGTGDGQVRARMTAANATGSAGAIELVAWLRYYPREALTDLGAVLPWSLGLGLLLVTATAVLARRVYRRAARQ